MNLKRTNRETGCPAERGFTLVELLVVVSIIALLISILLPSLKKAREQAKASVCISNLKGISSASLTYAAGDRNEQAVPVHPLLGSQQRAVGEYEWGGKSGKGEPVAGSGSDPIESRWGAKYGRGPASRPLNPILYKGGFTDYSDNRGPGSINWINDAELDVPIYHCPSDRGYTGHHFLAWKESRLTSFDHYGNSYATSTLWTGVAGGGCRLRSTSVFLHPVSRIPNPANTVYFIENCGRYGYRVNYGAPDDEGCSSLSGQLGADVETVIKGWHGRAYWFVASFVDGHANMVKMQGHRNPAPELSFYPPDPLTGAPRTRENWRCVILRGPGWQIDNLPAPPVQTNIPCNIGVPVNPIE